MLKKIKYIEMVQTPSKATHPPVPLFETSGIPWIPSISISLLECFSSLSFRSILVSDPSMDAGLVSPCDTIIFISN